MEKALALLSGGLDSTISLSIALERYEINLILTFDYGQRAAECETFAASKIARYYNIPIKIMTLGWLRDITNTALVNQEKEIPNVTAGIIHEKPILGINSAQNVWVPNRNGLFLNIAASFAEAKGIETIIFGGNAEEAVTFPDNSSDFVKAINHAFEFSTLNKVKVITPVIGLNKVDMISLLKDKELLNHVWSCYHGGSTHCDHCESCSRLKRALIETGHQDIWDKKVQHAVKTH